MSYKIHILYCSRTEVMRLLSPESGGLSVLCRAESYVRDEAPLALRFQIDCSDSSPNEPYEFAEYLAHYPLLIDVWDADSLLLIGTCCVPLRRLMRQGSPSSRYALECDIVNDEVLNNVNGATTTTIIHEGGPPIGALVGSTHIILTNIGDRGHRSNPLKNEKNPRNDALSSDGFNWRVNHSNACAKDLRLKVRPKISVRAQPLSENAPELSTALQVWHITDGSDAYNHSSTRSLTALRGDEGTRTLTYDDVAVLFKRFQGSNKGTVKYSGPLMKLLDVPSWDTSVRKLVKAY